MPQPFVLRDYQVAAAKYIIDHPKCLVALPMAFGKTLTTLAALAHIKPEGHILIIAPKFIARSVWPAEVEQWGFPVPMKSLIVNDKGKQLSRAERTALYESIPSMPPTMFFINKEMVVDLIENMPTTKIGRKQVTLWPFKTMIIDESQTFKNPSSQRFKALKKVSWQCDRIIELSGTPMPMGWEDLYPQIFLLDQGQALGSTLTAFRETYMLPDRVVNGRVVSYKPALGAEEAIKTRVAHLMMSAENAALKLPDHSMQTIPIPLTPSVQADYQTFKKEAVLELLTSDEDEQGNPLRVLTAVNQAVLRNKLVQYLSGTAYVIDEQERRHSMTVHSLRTDVLFGLANSLDENMLVAYQYTADRDAIMSAAAKAKVDAQVFDGTPEMIDAWNRGEIKMMLIHPRSAGHGLNLQFGGSVLVWYTLTTSTEEYLQTNARLVRPGQTKHVQIFNFLTPGGVDAGFLDIVNKRRTVQQDLLDHVRIDVPDVVFA